MTAKDLKNALLQEAVQGKLTEGWRNKMLSHAELDSASPEYNARVLLEQIKKARGESLPLSPARKRSSATPSAGSNAARNAYSSHSELSNRHPELVSGSIPEEEIPFDIPESWCWCRLEDIADLRSGNQYLESETGTLYLKVADMNIQENNYEIITSSRHTSCSDDSYIPQFSIIFPKRGGAISTNKKKLVLKENVYVDSNTMGMTPKMSELLPYLYRWFDSIDLGELSTGTSVPQINNKDLYPLYFPLPPLAEQKRIVETIEKFMPLIEEYGKKEAVLKELNENIGTLTKKAILQEAVQGKLVPQIPTEGNAKDLVASIACLPSFASKTSKKQYSPIEEEEIPYDIPENWCWCRLGDVCKFLSRGKSPKYSDIRKYPVFAQKCNLKDGEISLDQAQFLDPEVLPKWKEEYKIQDGDILVNSTGTGTVMRTRYFKSEYLKNYPFVLPDSHVTVIRTHDEICSKYIFYCCFGFTVQKYWEENLAESTNQKELYIGVVGNTPIPLPPLAEQKRIVAAIEQLLPLCEKLGK